MRDKHKHAKSRGKKEKDHELSEELVKEVFKEAHKRRLIVRKPSGEVVFELPVTVSAGLFTCLTIFMFPVMVVVLIGGYAAKLRFEIIRDMTADEAQELDTADVNDTVLGDRQESGDGGATIAL